MNTFIIKVIHSFLKHYFELNKVIIISGDGDYFNLVNFLFEQSRFEKIIFPNKRFASSLY